MITMDGIEYDDNLNLETIDFVKQPNTTTAYQFSGTLNTRNLFYENGRPYYIYNGELYNFYSNKLYKYNGFSFDTIDTTLPFSVARRKCIPIVFEDDVYFVTTSQSTYNMAISIYKMNAKTYECTLFTSLPYNNTYYYVHDAIIYGDYLYLITKSYTNSETEYIRKISLSNKSLSDVYDTSTLIDGLCCSRFIIYKDKLYVMREYSGYTSSSNNKIQLAEMRELKNDSLQLISSLPIVYKTTSINLAIFFTDNDYIYLCPPKANIEYGQLYYIWRYDGESWTPFASYPIPKNSAYSTAKIYNCAESSIILNECSINICQTFETFIYNGSIHTFGPNYEHYIYNKDLHEWLEAGYWICEIKDDTSQTTT